MAGHEQEEKTVVKGHLSHLMHPAHGQVLLLQTEVTATASLLRLHLPEVIGMIY